MRLIFLQITNFWMLYYQLSHVLDDQIWCEELSIKCSDIISIYLYHTNIDTLYT